MNESSVPSSVESGANSFRKRGSSNNMVLITAAVAVALIVGLLIWKSIAVSQVTEEAKKNSENLKEQAANQIIQAHIQHLKILAKA